MVTMRRKTMWGAHEVCFSAKFCINLYGKEGKKKCVVFGRFSEGFCPKRRYLLACVLKKI